VAIVVGWQVGLQMRPHTPQLFASPVVSTQAPLHTVSLPGHAHAPPTHAVVGAAQAWPQVPQLPGSVVVSTHALLHTDSPVGHAQAPPWHV